MEAKVTELAKRLLQSGYDDLSERDQRILRRVAQRTAITQNVNEQFHEHQTFGQRLADKVAGFGGSWTFIALFGGVLIVWVLINAWALPSAEVFDPYPFVFLNLLLSMVAAFQAPVIMMSQNRQSAKDRLAATLDYEVNLKAELEIMGLHEKLDHVRQQQLERILQQQADQIDQLRLLLENAGAK